MAKIEEKVEQLVKDPIEKFGKDRRKGWKPY